MATASPLLREHFIAEQRDRLTALQKPDGHFVFELEADATIPAEYILLKHFLDERGGEAGLAREQSIAVYLRRIQNPDGSWPLFHLGEGDISATIKAYWALKLIGEPIDAPHMAAARAWVLARGGAAKANVFTRFALALFGEVPWRAVPVMPVEIMLLPQWFFFHMSKVAYWSRTVIAPLLVLYALKARAKNPTGQHIRELFIAPPEQHRPYNINPTGAAVGDAFLLLDKALRFLEPMFPKGLRRKAIDAAVAFFTERLNGEDGLGAIYPAMANAVMAMDVLGFAKDDPRLVTAKHAIELLVVERVEAHGPETYVQPCVSPIWDTGLAAHALLEASNDSVDPAVKRALDWLKDRQILEVKGDWAVRRPNLRPGGWAFQYWNNHYPDVDDTAVVAIAMIRARDPAYDTAVARAAEWIIGMQSSNGGWGAFDPENEHYYLNAIPFADHGALLDPPTADVTARCISFLAEFDPDRRDPIVQESIRKAVEYLKREQEPDGSWFGRWGANYIYGTWSVLCALNAAGLGPEDGAVARAASWLAGQQRDDGGWGEDLATYDPARKGEAKESTPSQTAWAVMGLMAAGQVDSPATARGVQWLEQAPRDGARWQEDLYTGTGFPRVFYLKYHGYAAYFPLWAVARYENLTKSNTRRVPHGM